MNEGVNQEAIPDVDIQYPDQDVATGPDYGSGDLIAFKVIDIPDETPDGEMSPRLPSRSMHYETKMPSCVEKSRHYKWKMRH